jgi:uncharacterized membrane protein HdeD (DUF308 family)
VREFLGGALAMGNLVAALFFLKFWRQSRDRLFAIFGAAFLVLAVQRVALAVSLQNEWDTTWAYALRLGAFVLLLGAIVDKNRARRG